MATTGIGLILLFTIDCALSSHQSGILSNLYKTAVEEKRPMIVVIKKENGDKEDSKFSDYPHKKDLTLKKPLKYKENAEKLLSKSLLQHLTPHYHIINQQSHGHNHEHSKPNFHSQARSRPRLLSQSNRDDRDDRHDVDRDDRREDRDRQRNNRDRRDRNRYDRDRRDRDDSDRHDRDHDDNDRRDRDRYDRDRRDRDRDDRDRRDRDRYDRDRRDQDRDDNDFRDRGRYYNEKSIDRTLRALIQNTLNPQAKKSDDPTVRALRSSVVKNLLRAANDLNCEAKDECEDECTGKGKYDCEDRCEQEFECEAEKKDEYEKDGCDLEDECGQDNNSREKNRSTRGVRYEEEKTGCRWC